MTHLTSHMSPCTRIFVSHYCRKQTFHKKHIQNETQTHSNSNSVHISYTHHNLNISTQICIQSPVSKVDNSHLKTICQDSRMIGSLNLVLRRIIGTLFLIKREMMISSHWFILGLVSLLSFQQIH
jgi:hypothetical protein